MKILESPIYSVNDVDDGEINVIVSGMLSKSFDSPTSTRPSISEN